MERDQEVDTGQEPGQLLFEPLPGLVPLAARTMAVATGLGPDVIRATVLALIQHGTQFSGAAALQQVHRAELFTTQTTRELAAIGRTVLPQDLAERGLGGSRVHVGGRGAEDGVTHGCLPAERSSRH